MNAVNLADAEGRWGELLDRVEAGETLAIMRGGKLVAQLTPPQPRPPIDWAAIDALRESLPYDATNSVFEMRKLDRY